MNLSNVILVQANEVTDEDRAFLVRLFFVVFVAIMPRNGIYSHKFIRLF